MTVRAVYTTHGTQVQTGPGRHRTRVCAMYLSVYSSTTPAPAHHPCPVLGQPPRLPRGTPSLNFIRTATTTRGSSPPPLCVRAGPDLRAPTSPGHSSGPVVPSWVANVSDVQNLSPRPSPSSTVPSMVDIFGPRHLLQDLYLHYDANGLSLGSTSSPFQGPFGRKRRRKEGRRPFPLPLFCPRPVSAIDPNVLLSTE